MQIDSSRKLFYGLVILFIGIMGAFSTSGSKAALADTQAAHAEWTFLLPGLADASDPLLVDVSGNGKLDIVAATHNGHVVAVDRNGNQLWDRDISPYFGLPNNRQRILAAPAAADLDNNGSVEIVIATGTADSDVCYPGGVIVLKNNGEIAPGNWPFMMFDGTTLPENCSDGIYGTPAIVDMDGDGDKEIGFGSFDKRLYVLNHDGTAVPGFPIDSALRFRFPAWGNITNQLADTIWSSAAAADLDGNGTQELIVGTDEGHFGDSYGGNKLDWYCPYPNTLTPEYCGGSLYAVQHNGQLYVWPDDGDPAAPNYQKNYWEHIQSTPVVADLNEDGVLDIVHGMGTYYQILNPSYTYANRVVAINGATGQMLAGWNDFPGQPVWGQGKTTGAPTPGSPAIGDITGDGKVDVVILAMDGRVYAWHANGQVVSGFPKQTYDIYNTTLPFNVGSSPMLVDYDGDSVMEILLLQNTSLVVIDGNGTQLTPSGGSGFNSLNEIGGSEGGRFSATTPAIADIDEDGRLEVVVASGLASVDLGEGKTRGRIIVWELPNSTTNADWPMYKQNAARTSSIPIDRPILEANKTSLVEIKLQSDANVIEREVTLSNTGTLAYDWSLSSVPAGVSINPSSGTVNPGGQVNLAVSIDVNSTLNDSFVVNAIGEDANPAINSPLTIGVDVFVVDTIHRAYLPFVIKQ